MEKSKKLEPCWLTQFCPVRDLGFKTNCPSCCPYLTKEPLLPFFAKKNSFVGLEKASKAMKIS